jgi:hypothetical protein
VVQWSNQFLHGLKGVSTGETRQGRTAQGCTIRPGPLVAISADIVSAYISNNPLPAADLPNFIGQIYASLKVISVATPAVRSGELKTCCSGKELRHIRIHHLPRRRQTLQIAETAYWGPLWPYTGSISSEVEPAVQLPDGGSKLFRSSLDTGQIRGAGPKGEISCRLRRWRPRISAFCRNASG